jgi:hypothetical protein
MADHPFRLPPDCDSDPAIPAPDENQLAFPFAAGDDASAPGPLPAQSRRELRSQRLGRSLLVPAIARPLEELQLEHGVACHLPPGKVLSLKLTDNHYTIISVQRGRECYRVRAHRMFAGAEPRLVRALARYVVHNDQRASALLSDYIEQNQGKLRRPTPRPRRQVLRTGGRFHDLQGVYDRLNRAHFGGKLDLRITWGAARRHAAQRSIKVGTFLVEDRLIRVHPVLDQAMVPDYFLDWIVFHEMLHGKHAIRRVAGRRCFHPPEFAQEEKRFPDYWRARLWEKANLDRLLG